MKYTILDENELPMAFYSDDIHLDIPKEAIEITEDQWLECINNQGQRRLVDGELVEYIYVPTDVEIIAQKVQEAIAFLTATNHKDFPRYIPKEGEDMETLYAKREEALLFIRENK